LPKYLERWKIFMTNKEMRSPTEGPAQVKIVNDFALYFPIHHEVPRQYQSVFAFIHQSGRSHILSQQYCGKSTAKRLKPSRPCENNQPSFYPYSSIHLNRSFLQNFLLVGNLAFAYPALR
jgi:hypothetical protein